MKKLRAIPAKWVGPTFACLVDYIGSYENFPAMGRWKWNGKWHALCLQNRIAQGFSRPINIYDVFQPLILHLSRKKNQHWTLAIPFPNSPKAINGDVSEGKLSFEPALDRSSSSVLKTLELSRMILTKLRGFLFTGRSSRIEKIFNIKEKALCLRRPDTRNWAVSSGTHEFQLQDLGRI